MAQTSFEDIDSSETQEWLDAFSSLNRIDGVARAQFVLDKLITHAQGLGYRSDSHKNTPYCNSIKPQNEAPMQGDLDIEQRLRALVR